MMKNVPKFGQNIDNLLLCKQRIQETGKLYVKQWPKVDFTISARHFRIFHVLLNVGYRNVRCDATARDWLAEMPPLSPRSDPSKALFLQGRVLT